MYPGKSIIIWVANRKHVIQKINFVLCRTSKVQPQKFVRAEKGFRFSNSPLVGIGQMLLLRGQRGRGLEPKG